MSDFQENFDNPYVASNKSQRPETQPLDEILRQALDNAAMKLRVWLPASITQVLGNQKVNIQPLLQSRYTDGTLINLPIIQNVMVAMPMGQSYSIKLPIAVGDTGYALFCDRSLDVWSSGAGTIVDPQDTRSHNINDPIFIPGLAPFLNQTTDTTSDLVLTNQNSQIRMEQGGGFKIQNIGANQELITILLSLLNTLISNTFTLTSLGPQPFIASTIAALTQIQSNLTELQG